jgi:hypothetical protein
MDKEKEGLITSLPEALAEAAQINMAATKEMASSAVTAFVDTLTGREKRSGKRGVSKKKASSASKRSKTRSSAATRPASTAKQGRRSTRRTARKPDRKGS